jgi:hypothetical protein
MIGRHLMLLDYRADLGRRAEPTPEWGAYVKAENIDLTVYAFIGILAVTRARFFPARRFEFHDEGIPVAVCEVLGGRKAGGGWMARCPAHDIREPSMPIRDADEGQVLVHCHVGCDQHQVIAALKPRRIFSSEGSGS